MEKEFARPLEKVDAHHILRLEKEFVWQQENIIVMDLVSEREFVAHLIHVVLALKLVRHFVLLKMAVHVTVLILVKGFVVQQMEDFVKMLLSEREFAEHLGKVLNVQEQSSEREFVRRWMVHFAILRTVNEFAGSADSLLNVFSVWRIGRRLLSYGVPS